jgi:hypothetical protein
MERSRLETLARRAYERGRLVRALLGSLFAIPFGVISLVDANCPEIHASLAACLFLTSTMLLWRGGPSGRAVRAGAIAGFAPLIAPLCLRSAEHVCFGPFCASPCLLGCLAGGILAGALLGARASRLDARSRQEFLIAGAAISVLSGSLGCIFAGIPGLAGMALGLIATSAPIAVLVPRFSAR